MKKHYLFLLVAIIFAISCKTNSKPIANNGVGDAPPTVELGKEQAALYREVYDKLKDYVGTTVNFASTTPLRGSTGLDKLKNKILIYQDKNTAKWIALGVAGNGQNVFVGIGDNNDDVTSAVKKASLKSNWDSRKLFYYIDDNGSTNGNNSSISLSWSARIGKPTSSGIINFAGFDASGDGIEAGHDKEYTLVSPFDKILFTDKGWWNRLTSEERASHRNGRNANFIIEKTGVSIGNNTKRKAWLWDFWNAPTMDFEETSIHMVKPEYMRFGYTTDNGDYFPGGVGNQSQDLSKVADSGEITTTGNNVNPIGKVIFTRVIDHSKFGWNSGVYNTRYAVFFATVVGYNVRMITISPNELSVNENLLEGTGWTKDTPFEIVVMEFSDKAYADAAYDKWDSTLDLPLNDVTKTTELLNDSKIPGFGGGTGADKYQRMYFIVAKE